MKHGVRHIHFVAAMALPPECGRATPEADA